MLGACLELLDPCRLQARRVRRHSRSKRRQADVWKLGQPIDRIGVPSVRY